MNSDTPLDLYLDPASHDLVFDQNDLSWVSGISGIQQCAKIAMLMVRGEWFRDLDEGLPYFEREGVPAEDALIGQKFNKTKALDAYRQALLSVPGTNEIIQLDIAVDSARVMRVSWQLRTVFGDTPVNVLDIGV